MLLHVADDYSLYWQHLIFSEPIRTESAIFQYNDVEDGTSIKSDHWVAQNWKKMWKYVAI